MHDPYRPWAAWRRFWYGTGFSTIIGVIAVLVYFTQFYQPPSCFDGIQNDTERGIDCGGACVQICTPDVMPPRVAWAESFLIAPGRYNAVAYIENRNPLAGVPEVAYTFTFYAGDTVVGEQRGVTPLPPNSSYPVFAGPLFIEEEITETTLTLQPADYWLPATTDPSQFRTVNFELLDPDNQPRLTATVENTTLAAAENIDIIATIFNDQGDPVTASKTFVDDFPARSTERLVFTWPSSIAKTVRSCSIPTDVVLGIDLSGSMNNDLDTPPQPLTDALSAAQNFVLNLGGADQVGVVSFATEARLEQGLTGAHERVGQIVSLLSIDAASETGFTNTAAAIETAATELTSERHSDRARRALVLLTDGLPTAAGDIDAEAAAIRAAEQLVNSGADVYAIGLGENVNQSFVEALASDSSNAYLAPDRTELEEIYTAITDSLCEVGPTKIEIIPQITPEFAPLR